MKQLLYKNASELSKAFALLYTLYNILYMKYIGISHMNVFCLDQRITDFKNLTQSTIFSQSHTHILREKERETIKVANTWQVRD